MTLKDLKEGTWFRNKKHGVDEYKLCECKLRREDGTWVDGVVYKGTDRFTGKKMVFVRELQSFLEDFERV